MPKQAVVVIHGMGEQLPMETLLSFVDAAWANDATLVSSGKPDPNTGGKRTGNAYWSKPDRLGRSFELRVIATESGENRKRTEFYEYYWAHLMVDTTWGQVRAWVFELLFRNPFTKVPRGVLPVWLLLWAITIAAVAAWILSLRPGGDAPTWLGAIAAGLASAAVAWFVFGFIVSYFGDVARYVKPKPGNVARRQEIRENGVRLLESLMGEMQADGTWKSGGYERIVVVAHSLGTIVAYDILAHTFARVHGITNQKAGAPAPQDARHALEQLIRDGLEAPAGWSLEAFRSAQEAAAAELGKAGNPWIVSDFVTLGSPLTHAEFLIVKDREALARAKAQRVLPCCPPTLEYDGTTKLRHFTYRSLAVGKIGPDEEPLSPRVPHHAALFAYTRWTNIHSPHWLILWGDIISGKLGTVFGLEAGGATLNGISDVAVMPARGADGKKLGRRHFFTHTKYWNERVDKGTETPRHIAALRAAMRLGE